MNAIFHVGKADFLQKVRKSSFLITLGFVVFLAYVFIPAADAGYVTLRFGDYRGINSSAWVGCSAAISTMTFLGLIGFYLVKGSIGTDRSTGVGFIIAATPITKFTYILGKVISNFAILAIMTMITSTAIIPMQFLRGAHFGVDLWAIYSPFVILVLPFMLLIAALAVLFEVIPFIKGAFGNVLYFFMYIALLGMEVLPVQNGLPASGMMHDIMGVGIILGSAISYAMSTIPDYHGGSTVDIIISNTTSKTFMWDGMEWTAQILVSRLYVLAIVLVVISLTVIFFRRFDS